MASSRSSVLRATLRFFADPGLRRRGAAESCSSALLQYVETLLECSQNSFGQRRIFDVTAVVELPDHISLNIDVFAGFNDVPVDVFQIAGSHQVGFLVAQRDREVERRPGLIVGRRRVVVSGCWRVVVGWVGVDWTAEAE
jgi:hypothetical protein